jgi:hypothetical protein
MLGPWGHIVWLDIGCEKSSSAFLTNDCTSANIQLAKKNRKCMVCASVCLDNQFLTEKKNYLYIIFFIELMIFFILKTTKN